MKIVYKGPADRIKVPAHGLEFEQGEERDVEDAVAEDLLTLPGHNFQAAEIEAPRRTAQARRRVQPEPDAGEVPAEQEEESE